MNGGDGCTGKEKRKGLVILLLTILRTGRNERQGVSLLRSRSRCKSSRTGKLCITHTDSVHLLLLETTESGIEVRVTTDLASSFSCIGVWKKCSSNVAKASSVSSLSFLRNQEERIYNDVLLLFRSMNPISTVLSHRFLTLASCSFILTLSSSVHVHSLKWLT